MDGLIFVIYLVLGYWAAGVCFYENKIVFHAFGQLFLKNCVLVLFLAL